MMRPSKQVQLEHELGSNARVEIDTPFGGNYEPDECDREQVERLHCRKPGMVQRVSVWAFMHFGLLAGVSLVGWLIALVLAAMMLLPGCASPEPEIQAREDGAFQETEHQLARYAGGLADGTADLEAFKRFLHDALENLKTAERGERENAGLGWVEVSEISTGIGGAIAFLLHKLRNTSRKKDLGDLVRRLEALETEPGNEAESEREA